MAEDAPATAEPTPPIQPTVDESRPLGVKAARTAKPRRKGKASQCVYFDLEVHDRAIKYARRAKDGDLPNVPHSLSAMINLALREFMAGHPLPEPSLVERGAADSGDESAPLVTDDAPSPAYPECQPPIHEFIEGKCDPEKSHAVRVPDVPTT